MKQLFLVLSVMALTGINASAQGKPDTVIYLQSVEAFNQQMQRLEKAKIAYSWRTPCCGGDSYDYRGTGKCIEYRYNNSHSIKTRRKGGEIIFPAD